MVSHQWSGTEFNDIEMTGECSRLTLALARPEYFCEWMLTKFPYRHMSQHICSIVVDMDLLAPWKKWGLLPSA